MKAPLYNIEGKETGTVDIPDAMFGVKLNRALVRQVLEVERANRRPTIAHTKTRGEVRGGGKKPWKQKHTGRARHGSTRSPLWRGGGATFGPRKKRDFSKEIPKKMKRQALYQALSAKLKDGEIFFIDELKISAPKTKEFVKIMQNFPVVGKSVAFVSARDTMLERAARNIPRLSVLAAPQLNALDLLSNKYVLFPKEALLIVEKVFLKK